MAENGNGTAKLKSWFGLIIGGSLLSVVVSYGTVKLKEGADAQRLTALEKDVQDIKDRRDRNESVYATKEYIDLKLAPIIQSQQGQNTTLQEILNNVRRR